MFAHGRLYLAYKGDEAVVGFQGDAVNLFHAGAQGGNLRNIRRN